VDARKSNRRTKLAENRKASENREATSTHEKGAPLVENPKLVAQLRRFARSFIIDVARCERLEEKIDQLFNGRLFIQIPPHVTQKQIAIQAVSSFS
jgi:hypothetical protein